MKKIDTKPFDRYKIPPKQNLFLMPIIWLICFLSTRSGKLKIQKERMKKLKPPYIVLGTHHAFMDFCVTPLALFPHRANYVSELEGFEKYGEWLYRQIGCLGTRKYVNDLALISNVKEVMKRKGIVVIYPEARYTNVGTFSQIPESVGKLTKILDVPVVVIQMHGNYLQSPIWNLKKRKGVRLEATISQVFTREELRKTSVSEINRRLSEVLTYDEYRWQMEKGISIKDPNRAKGLELPLYQCPVCGVEFQMRSKGIFLFCRRCKTEWEMDEFGKLQTNYKITYQDMDIDFSHIPNWYEWERKQVEQLIDNNRYELKCKVRIESLPNAVNFIECGIGELIHTREGFYLTFCDYGKKQPETMYFSAASMFSVHTEYDYRKKGQCITLSTLNNTYFLYPLEDGFNVTKIQFATEYLYKKGMKNVK